MRQVVEMSNGQQLEMVDGSLIEIRPASLQVRFDLGPHGE